MQITKINIEKSPEVNDGLESIKMEKLGSIVLIAGKNGSGKTRILNKILKNLPEKRTKDQVNYAIKQIQSFESQLNYWKQALERDKINLISEKNEQVINNLNNAIEQSEQQIRNILSQKKGYEDIRDWNIIETSELSEKYEHVAFVPKQLSLSDCSELPKQRMISVATNISHVGMNNLPAGAFARIQTTQDKWFNATHQSSKASDKEKKKAIKDYEKLCEFIWIFLNTTVERTISDEATLFGFPMGKANLSDGQKILLQFCLAIYSQETALKDLILILDEPENHLHPSILIETLERIQKCSPHGQIWIATHSIPLLAHFDPSLIWFVENGKIRHAGKIPEKVLHSLLGGEEEVGKLQDFISLPAQYATSRYALECLVEPPTVMTSSTDPQSHQIRAELLKLSTDGKLRVLDYGAGKGRLISNIYDLEQEDNAKLIENLDYIAYDKLDTDKEFCESSIKKAYEDSSNRYFNDISKLLSHYDKGSFNVIIMCNVLHEIDPKDWLSLFSSSDSISSLLADNGLLLIVEDHQMPTGELAYQKGFLVFDTAQLKALFKITEADTNFKFSSLNAEDRLKEHRIPKSCLTRINENSRIDALKSLSQRAREKILEIRIQEKNYKNGKLHGFWTQQFANAELSLAELRSNH